MSREWTPEQRAEFGRKMQEKREAKLRSEHNPIANDVIATAARHAKPVHAHRDETPELPETGAVSFDTPTLISDLGSIPLNLMSYADCGLLLNALSAASTAVALARRQKQEQLEAGTMKSPCKTCGRIIDISKPGGFQILTEWDEHRIARNIYFCSQHCLLARNMPSHAKQTPKQKNSASA